MNGFVAQVDGRFGTEAGGKENLRLLNVFLLAWDTVVSPWSSASYYLMHLHFVVEGDAIDGNMIVVGPDYCCLDSFESL